MGEKGKVVEIGKAGEIGKVGEIGKISGNRECRRNWEGNKN